MNVRVVPLSRYSTGLRALFRDDQATVQPTMFILISLPSLSSLPSLLSFRFLALWLQAPIPNYPFSFVLQVILADTSVPHLSASQRIENSEPPHNRCVHRLFTGYEPPIFDINIGRHLKRPIITKATVGGGSPFPRPCMGHAQEWLYASLTTPGHVCGATMPTINPLQTRIT